MEPNWKEKVEERRVEVARMPLNRDRFKGTCELCEEEADNVHAYIEHGLCEACRDAALTLARATRTCPRCSRPLAQGRRFYTCGTCALVIAIDPEDRVAAVHQERSDA